MKVKWKVMKEMEHHHMHRSIGKSRSRWHKARWTSPSNVSKSLCRTTSTHNRANTSQSLNTVHLCLVPSKPRRQYFRKPVETSCFQVWDFIPTFDTSKACGLQSNPWGTWMLCVLWLAICCSDTLRQNGAGGIAWCPSSIHDMRNRLRRCSSLRTFNESSVPERSVQDAQQYYL